MPHITHSAPDQTSAETGEQNGNETRFGIDEAVAVLSAERRRRVVEFLNEEGSADLSTIAEAVAVEESGPGFDAQERKRVYIALYQSHVPKMEEYGVVETDGGSGVVHIGPGFEATVRFLRALQRVEDRQNEEESRPRFRTLRDLLSG